MRYKMIKYLNGLILALFLTGAAQADDYADYTLMDQQIAGVTTGGAGATQWAWTPKQGEYWLDSGSPSAWPPGYSEVFVVQKECPVPQVRVTGAWGVYGPDTRFYKYTMQKEEVEHGPGQIYDITAYCGSGGQHYVTFDIQSHQYIQRSWGDIWVDAHHVSRWYHESRWSPPVVIYNPAMNQSALAIKQEEKWWEETWSWGGTHTPGKWILGSGSTPYTAAGAPLDVAGGHYGRSNYFGKGKGILWRVDDGVTRYSLGTWPW